MSSRQKVFGPGLAIFFGILVFGGAGCRTCYHTDEIKDACQGKPAGEHDIEVNDMGEVSAPDTCVVVSRTANHSVRWRPRSNGQSVSITFLLSKGQPVPFDRMSCGRPDRSGTQLCVLIDCPDNCKTTFRNGYEPSKKKDDPINYYFYSAGVAAVAGGPAKAGSDPGIRIDP
jgi:hypothetical protein